MVAPATKPANQLRIHTLLSLEKHADIGATFAAIPAGYLLARLAGVLGGARSEPGKQRAIRYGLATLVVTAVALVPLNIDGDKRNILKAHPLHAERVP